MSNFRNNLGQHLKLLRKYNSLPLRKVAAHMDIDPSTLSKIESGKRRMKKENLRSIAELFEIPLEQLNRLYVMDEFIDFIYQHNIEINSLKEYINLIEDDGRKKH